MLRSNTMLAHSARQILSRRDCDLSRVSSSLVQHWPFSNWESLAFDF